MNSIKKTVLILVVASISLAIKGATCISLGNGNWTNPLNWSCGAVPNCGDSIVILAAHTITITAQQDYTGCSSPLKITIYGTLKFTNGNKLRLPCGSIVYVMSGGSINPGTGGGNSNTIEICGDIFWNAGSGVASGPTCFPPCGPLPIELISFKGKVLDDEIKLEWATATEINNKSFVVERSQNADTFESIGVLAGSGNSQTAKNYIFYDKDPLNGVAYYRLKQIDFDNSFKYTSIIAVNTDVNKATAVYPNPFEDQLTVEINTEKSEETLTINVVDLTGKRVKNLSIKTLQNTSTYTVDLNSIQDGFYFLQVIKQSGEFFQTKLIKN